MAKVMRLNLTVPGLLIGIILGSLPGMTAGVLWQNFRIASLENRFVAATQRFDVLVRDFNAEVVRERDEDQNLERGIADNRRDLTDIRARLPLQLPTVAELIEQAQHLKAMDGRMDEQGRAIAALSKAAADRAVVFCSALAKLSAASAKGSGC